jgi:hypothetical protein
MGNLKVADSEYTTLAHRYSSLAFKLDTAYQSYVDILATICQNAISDGTVHKNLQAFTETAQALCGQFNEIALDTSEMCSGFVNGIDEADRYLY